MAQIANEPVASVAPAERHAEAVEAFEDLLQPVLSRAYAAALGMTGSRPDAEDLVQEAALRACRAFGTFRPGTNFSAWFLRILTNVFRARLRKEQWMRGSVSVTEAPDALIYAWRQPSDLHREARDPAAEAIGRLETSQVLQAFQELPAPFRTAVSLYFVEEFTYQEIADVLRCSLGTVRSRIHRGRKLLQRALAPLAPAAMGQPAA